MFFFSSQNTLPSIWKALSESCQFPCSFLLASPRQWRAFWADSAPFVDTGRLIIGGNYQPPSHSQVKMALSLTTTRFSVVSIDDEVTTLVNEGLWVGSKSPLLARLVRMKEQGNGRELIPVMKFLKTVTHGQFFKYLFSSDYWGIWKYICPCRNCKASNEKKAGTMQYCFHEKECNEKVGCSNRNWQYGLLLGLSGNGGPFTIQYSLGPFLSF